MGSMRIMSGGLIDSSKNHLTSFRMKNIKSYIDTNNIEIAPITIFVGKNSCGKSSLVRFPVLLSQTFAAADSPLKLNGMMLDCGSFADIIHAHGDGDITFELTFNIDIKKLDVVTEPIRSRIVVETKKGDFVLNENTKENEKKISFEVTIGVIDRLMCIKKIVLSMDNSIMYRLEQIKGNVYRFVLSCMYDKGELIKTETEYCITTKVSSFEGFFPDIRIGDDEIWDCLNPNKEYNAETVAREIRCSQYAYGPAIQDDSKISMLPDEEKKYISIVKAVEYLTVITMQLKGHFDHEWGGIRYLGPFRDGPERVYRDQEKDAQSVGTRGSNVSTLLINDHNRGGNLINEISVWLRETIGYGIALKELGSGLYQIMIEDSNGFQANIMDVGYGISQVLPIITQICQTPKNAYYNKFIVIEQPELHLHPAAQANIAGIFVDSVLSGNTRFMIETHSEHLIRKLQVYIADPSCGLSKDMVKIYYVDKSNEGNESQVKEMKIDDDGRFLEEWPSGFFDKAFDLTMELASF